jgi:hypothetical protein
LIKWQNRIEPHHHAKIIYRQKFSILGETPEMVHASFRLLFITGHNQRPLFHPLHNFKDFFIHLVRLVHFSLDADYGERQEEPREGVDE